MTLTRLGAALTTVGVLLAAIAVTLLIVTVAEGELSWFGSDPYPDMITVTGPSALVAAALCSAAIATLGVAFGYSLAAERRRRRWAG